MKYSVIIPTCNANNVLYSCINSILDYTDIDQIELIVVANGCTQETKIFLDNLNVKLKLIWEPNLIGFPRAVNLGIKNATCEYVVILNDDTVLTKQNKNKWLELLETPLKNEKAGISCPVITKDRVLNVNLPHFFCVMIKKSVFDAVGLLDENYGLGGCEDVDFSFRAIQQGFTCELPTEMILREKEQFGGTFPIIHSGNNTLNHPKFNYTNVLNSNKITFYKKYLKNIKLNLGSGNYPKNDYLNIDLLDTRADVIMDAGSLQFDDNSVDEIFASHLFQQLNPFKILKILNEWHRVLKPGAKIILEMPNIEELCKQFLTADKISKYKILNSMFGTINTLNTPDKEEIPNPNLFGWFPEIVSDHLHAAGFTEIKVLTEQGLIHDSPNFRIEAKK